MPEAFIRFYEELNDFIPSERRKTRFTVSFFAGETVKSIIENLGIPHTEVDLITVGSESVAFSHQPAEGDFIDVYPVFESFDVSRVTKVRSTPLRTVRFILDIHLGKLAKSLRMLGFDAAWEPPFDDPSLATRSRDEHRILLTSDRGLLKRKIVTHGYCVRSSDPDTQLKEIVRRFDLIDLFQPFTRCMECNTPLVPRAREEVRHRLPANVRDLEVYSECPSCANLYWRGSHWDRMVERIDGLFPGNGDDTADEPDTGNGDDTRNGEGGHLE